MFIDTHCHLSKDDYDDIDLVIKENRNNSVDKIIVSGCDKKGIEEALVIAQAYDDVFLTIGFHPSEARQTTEEELVFLEETITKNKNKIVGIGEIGLDYHYGKEDILLQKELFRKQMNLASKLKLPVVIHSREATADTIEILKEFSTVVGDIHCFSGSVETAFEYLRLGYKLGIGGVVTFKNSNLFKVVNAVGIDHILLETDAPYIAPEPIRGTKNSSKNLIYIAEKVAETLNISLEEVAEKTTYNAVQLFDLP